MGEIRNDRWYLHTLLASLLLMAAMAFTYQAAPDNGFHFDDTTNITLHTPIRIETLSLDAVLNAGREAFLSNRPLPSMTYAIDWWRGGGKPAPFIWTNMVLHAATGLVVFALLTVMLARNGPPRPLMIWAAALGTAAWMLHPIQVQAVTYVVQRMTEMAALFSLLSVFAYVYARTRARRPWVWYLLTVASFAVAAYSKENAWITPLLWLLAEYGLCRPDGSLVRTPMDRYWLLLPLLGALWFIGDILIGGPLSSHFGSQYGRRAFTMVERLLTQPGVVLFHLGQILWPLPGRFSLEHDFPLSRSLFEPATLAAWVLVGAWMAAGLRLLVLPAGRLVGFCMLWLPVTLVIESSIVPLEMVFEHRMYLPSFGLAGLLAIGLHAAWQRRGVLRAGTAVAALAFVLFAAWSTQVRLPLWSDTLTLYKAALPHAPNSHRLWGNLSSYYGDRGMWDEAESAANRSLELRPGQSVAREVLAVLALERGEFEQAERELRDLAGKSTDHVTLNHLGEAVFAQGRHFEAAELFTRSVRMAPWMPPYHWNLALAMEGLDQCPRAFESWRRYLELEEEDVERVKVLEHLDERYRASDGVCARPGGWPSI